MLKPTEFHNGCVYHLLERNGSWVMYSQAYTHTPDKIIGYELFRLRKSKRTRNEKFPATSDWGRDAYTRYVRPQGIRQYLENRISRGLPTNQKGLIY